jgi:peptide/nickel transport system substrate-binding protein
MIGKNPSKRKNLTTDNSSEVKSKNEKEDSGRRYNNLQTDKDKERLEIPPQNDPIPIFWEDRFAAKGIFEKIRTFFWFIPDYIFKLIHKTRPFSYMIFYGFLTLISWRAVTYAANTPESLFNYTPEQVLQESAVGKVEILNPLFVTHNQLERDLREIIFNSLIEIGPDGIPQKELAKNWAISSNGKQYTFFLREDVYWHDGELLTADDIIYTFETIQELKDEDSFSKAFEDVEFGKIDDFTVTFNLPQKNSTFMENLCIGIVPQHLLQDIRNVDLRSSVYNQYPIGTGPFQISLNTQEQVVLNRNVNYFKGSPKLEKIKYTLYQDEDTLINDLKQFKYHTFTNPSPNGLEKMSDYQVYTTKSFTIHLRDKLIFFNLRKEESVLAKEKVRQAVSMATDRNSLIETLGTGGEVAFGPISKYSWAFNDSIERYNFDLNQANQTLNDAGWKFSGEAENRSTYRKKNGNDLSIKLTLLDTPINNLIAQELKQQWQLAGINVIIDTQDYEKIASETISRRDFEALLFQVENTPDPDKYNFWHSLNSEYPGLNLSGYSYNRVDILLERARRETDRDKRKQDYDLMQKYVMQDMPAIYLYHPTYEFIAHKTIKGIVDFENVSLPHQRYNNVHKWYIGKE